MTNEIYGAIRSYQANDNANGGSLADPSIQQTVDELFDGDYTTPGFINIPVCTPEMAETASDDSSTTSEPNYPCILIVTNIAGTQGSWEVECTVGDQHQLVQYGTCAFGVTGTTGTGDVDFNVGAQDIVDLITSSIQMFASGGLVGASGNMACQGDAGNDNVNWGLYHT
ncbi:hypothetical protein N7522_006726 [Penicillium canescens]|nr:hypothetical protein N7522_006726 [Penicillium canescens]